MSLGGADQIINPSRTHLFQRILCWDTAIHEPGALNPRFHEGKISHTVFRSDPEIPPVSWYLLCFQDILRRPRENLPASILIPQPPERNPNVCPGCIQNVSPFPIPPPADHFQNTYSSDHKAERHTSRQTDCPIALLKNQT